MVLPSSAYFKIRCCAMGTLVVLGLAGLSRREPGTGVEELLPMGRGLWTLLLEDLTAGVVSSIRAVQELQLLHWLEQGMCKLLEENSMPLWQSDSLAALRIGTTTYASPQCTEDSFLAYCRFYQTMLVSLKPWLEHEDASVRLNTVLALSYQTENEVRHRSEEREDAYYPCIAEAGPDYQSMIPVAQPVPRCPCCGHLMSRAGRSWCCDACSRPPFANKEKATENRGLKDS